MNKTLRIKVPGSDRGVDLVTWLSGKMKLSRNAAKRLVDSRQVFVNNQRIWMARHELASGDLVEVHTLETAAPSKKTEVLWQDDDFLIINKPAGVLSNGPESMETRLSRELDRPVHAVHRLDRDTSGCMLLAWTKANREKMIPIFQRREVIKIYEGLVIGKFPSDLDVIKRSIEGEEAVTLLKQLRRHGDVTRVEFTLVTGRTHQIRRHLTAYGLHLAGEKSYGSTVIDNPALRNISRHMLHAKTLGFPHPDSGVMVQVRAGLPADYRAAATAMGV